jgi:superfamily I DNA/RNA helicase
VVQEWAWHPQQVAIFNWFSPRDYEEAVDQPKHLIVNACAGTGKTTTLIEGVNRCSDEYVLICAFSKQIADELTRRIPRPNVDAKTLHSLGYFYIRREWRGIPVAEGNRRAEFLTEQVVDRKTPRPIQKLVSALHTKGRDLIPTDYSVDKLLAMVYEFDLEPDEGWGSQYDAMFLAKAAFLAMKYAAENAPTYDIGIDFADMMFLPLTWDLLTRDYDLVVVDEMQDMSKAQLLMAQAVCRGRIAGFGDRRQAIYGFRGADTTSMDRIKAELSAGELPLTVTYRCAQAVTRRAQTLVPAIEAAPTNPEGSVQPCTYTDMLMLAKAGDFILSRLNAPLVSAILRLLLMRKKAKMRGRQIGQGLIGLIRRLTRGNLSAITVSVLEERLDTWERKTVTKLASSGQKDLAEKVRDQAAMIRAFSEDAVSVQKVVSDIEELFTDVEDSDLVLLSSIHKAKGLEADTVYVLQETLYRRGPSIEEDNCSYVATTRAKTHLKLVTGVPGMEAR